MRTLEELRCALVVDEGAYIDEARAVVRDLIAHVQQQAEQIATLTARVAALEASEAERAIDRMVARRTGPGRPMESAGKVQTPAKLDEAQRAMPGDPTVRHVVAWMRATYPQNAHAHEWAGEIERVFLSHTAPPPPAAPAPASDDYEARARRYLADLWGVSVPAELEPFEGDVLKLATLLRAVADEAAAKAAEKARREERAACEAVCRRVAGEYEVVGAGARTASADECADRIAARGKDESPRTGQADG